MTDKIGFPVRDTIAMFFGAAILGFVMDCVFFLILPGEFDFTLTKFISGCSVAFVAGAATMDIVKYLLNKYFS